MEKRQKIQIDLSRFRNYVDTLFFKQNDVNVYPVEIEILNQGDPFNLAEVTHISFINETPISKSVVEGPCTILDAATGQIERLFGTNEIAEYGEAKAEIKLFSGEKLLSSAIFSYFIERTIDTDDSVESTPEYTSLQEALNRVDGALQEAENRVDNVMQEVETRVNDAISSIPSSVMKTWQPSRNVALGQVVYPTNPASPLAFECLQAGITGTVEPTRKRNASGNRWYCQMGHI